MTETPFVVAVVDDDASFREAVVWLLRVNGYDARSYADADSFIAQHDIVGHASFDGRSILSDAEWVVGHFAAAGRRGGRPDCVVKRVRRPKAVTNKKETTLDRLHRLGTIDDAQLQAGLLFRDDPEGDAARSTLPNAMRSVADHVIRQNSSISEWVRIIKPQGSAMNSRQAVGLVMAALDILAGHYGVPQKRSIVTGADAAARQAVPSPRGARAVPSC